MGKTEVVFLIGSNKLQKLGVHFVILLLNGMRFLSPIDLGTSWELALTDINTKFLSCFFLGLRYIDLSISTKYNEYHSLMNYLTKTGITLLDLIDFRDAVFFDQLNSIYNIRFSYAERIQATRLMKVKNNSNLLTQCPNGKQRLIRFSLNCLNFLP